LSRELRIIVERLSVGEVSEPLAARDGVRLLMICEKVTLPMTLPEREKIRAQLYNDKLELEANKLLRNLRREAFIEIKEKP
jgi:peptidyl-prolyl cis-trans isomerase SurA